MTIPKLRTGPRAATTAALTALLLAAATGASGGPPDAPPAKPLDERIDQERITDIEPPPLPEQVVLPKPPEFALATSHEQLPIDAEHFLLARRAIRDGLTYLLAQQHESGGWMVEGQVAPSDDPGTPSPVAVAVTALAVKALAQADPSLMSTRESPALRRGLQYIRRAQRQDGSFEGGNLTSYVTSTVVMALASLDRAQVADELNGGVLWLQEAQWDEGEGLGVRQDWYGGAGYGKHGRPDMSNTQLMLDALYDAGLSPDEPAFQRAMSFVSRAQNLKETNKADWAGDDGGFVYTPANGGESMASEAAGEGRSGRVLVAQGQPRSLRSYGSMTYAGFKSMFYAGMSPDDVRVRAAFDWIRRNWTFDENPGMGQQGLFYYYLVMARALAVAQQDVITDVDGTAHNWRQELIDAIARRQGDYGAWRNEADRWLEGEPVMATVDAVLALQEALKPTATAGRPADPEPGDTP